MKHNSNMKISQMKKKLPIQERTQNIQIFFHLLKFLSINQHTNFHSAKKKKIRSIRQLYWQSMQKLLLKGGVLCARNMELMRFSLWLFCTFLHQSYSLAATISPLTPINSFIWIANQSFLASGLPIYHFYISSEVPIYHFYHLDCQFIISIIWIAKHYQLDTAWFSELKSVSDNFPKFGFPLTHVFVQG